MSTDGFEPPDVVGSAEITALLNVNRQRLKQLMDAADRNGFPPPRELRTGRVWDRASVLAWDADRKAPAKARRTTVLRSYRQTGNVAHAARTAGVHVTTARRILRDLEVPLPND
jgi:predicted DNA-binding transcriptional regulator AlpA